MLFSTKAEYGVRLMVELGRRAGADGTEQAAPVSLAEVASAEMLPLAYLEHLVAKLREAALVGSVRGAHGGYPLGQARQRDRDARGGRGPRGPDRPDGVLRLRARGQGPGACTSSTTAPAPPSCFGRASTASNT